MSSSVNNVDFCFIIKKLLVSVWTYTSSIRILAVISNPRAQGAYARYGETCLVEYRDFTTVYNQVSMPLIPEAVTGHSPEPFPSVLNLNDIEGMDKVMETLRN
jgi:hypothetical protein